MHEKNYFQEGYKIWRVNKIQCILCIRSERPIIFLKGPWIRVTAIALRETAAQNQLLSDDSGFWICS